MARALGYKTTPRAGESCEEKPPSSGATPHFGGMGSCYADEPYFGVKPRFDAVIPYFDAGIPYFDAVTAYFGAGKPYYYVVKQG